ncbi:MAG: ABC transporter permease [Alphaproteobacteria bacterium]
MTTQAAENIIEPKVPSPFVEFITHFMGNKGALIGFIIVILIVLSAIFANLYPYSPTEILNSETGGILKLPPFFMEGGTLAHPFGTDPTGRDLLARVLHGARISLYLGLLSVSISLIIGVSFGLISGYVGGFVETLIMRMVDIMMSIPATILAMAIMAIFDQRSLHNTATAIAIAAVPAYIRITRASVLSEKTKDYIMASRVAGAGHLRLMLKAILPNCWAPIIVQATMGFSSAIIEAAALGFLGFGVSPPNPEWGTMLAENRPEMLTQWWAVAIPGMAIFITVMAFNLMGDGLRDALDPKMKS